MSYFSPYLDRDGLHFPTYGDRMEALLTEYRRIFGQDIYTGQDSPDYQLMSVFARAMDDLTAMIVDVYNARHPGYASGAALDLLLPMAGIRRKPATRSTVALQLRGEPNAKLPPNMQVKDKNGNIWRIHQEVNFDAQGQADAMAICEKTGAVEAAVGDVCLIHTPTANWYDAENAMPAVMGEEAESDAAARVRRELCVSLPSRSVLDGMKAALTNLKGVRYVSVLENSGSATDENGIPAHAICAVVEGGEPEEIAKTIYLKKAPGVGTYGNESAAYRNASGNSVTLHFSRPQEQSVTVRIVLRKLPGWDRMAAEKAIKQKVIRHLDGLLIGESLIVSSLYGQIFQANEGERLTFSVLSVQAETEGQSATADAVTAKFHQKLVADEAHVLLTIRED